MESYSEYEKADIANDYGFGSFEDSGDRLLLDMDSLVAKKEDMLIAKSIYDPPLKKCSLGEELEEVDSSRWNDKPVEDWCQEETINWLMVAASYLGQSYGSIQQGLAIPGRQLLALGRQDFVNRDPIYGDRLFGLLHNPHARLNLGARIIKTSKQVTTVNKEYDCFAHHQNLLLAHHHPFQLCYPDASAARLDGLNNIDLSPNSYSDDAESDNSVEMSAKRPPGRPRVLKAKKNSASQGKLWEFIRDLLRNKKTCPSLICWEDYSQAKFRFVRSDEVAKLWGSRKGNTKMTYEKLSRAMRYYYKRKIFLPVLGRRLVYQFGPNATGWQTDNPNFRYPCT